MIPRALAQSRIVEPMDLVRSLPVAFMLLWFCPVAQAQPIAVETRRVDLGPGTISQFATGPLRWRGGLMLDSSDDSFGGFSGLAFDPLGDRMTAVSDRARWFRARMVYDSYGNLMGLDKTSFGKLRGADGRPLQGTMATDAESLTRAADGGALVSFERRHRVLRYPDGLDGRAELVTRFKKPFVRHKNRGIEGLIDLGSGRYLGFVELGINKNQTTALLFDSKRRRERLYPLDQNFLPVGGARLPGGDVLVLERAFSKWRGFRFRLKHFTNAAISVGFGPLEGQVVQDSGAFARANFEGLASWEGPAGRPYIALISDDNFNSLLQTLLVIFEWTASE